MVAIARHIAHVASSKICHDNKRTQVKKHNQAIRALGRQMVHVDLGVGEIRPKVRRSFKNRLKILAGCSSLSLLHLPKARQNEQH